MRHLKLDVIIIIVFAIFLLPLSTLAGLSVSEDSGSQTSLDSGRQGLTKDIIAGEEAYKRGEYKSAFNRFFSAAEKGHPIAQYYLGVLYAYGQGVQKNAAEAFRWYLMAAEQEDMSAQFNLGFCFDKGRGVKQDYDEALKWYRKAADQGDRQAQYNIAVIYREVFRDYDQAFDLFSILADEGTPEAIDTIGAMYANGEGRKVDYVGAYIWFYLAKYKYHFKPAEQHLEKVKLLMNKDQLLDAELTATLMMSR